ncbi:MAG: sigma-70 family RNA polymerase sigma factor [Gammaproteobacteria bacterium]
MRKSRQAKFQLLVDGCSTDLYRYAAWLTGDRVLAEDLVQDTYLRAWRSLDGLKATSTSRYWLFMLLKREYGRHGNRPHGHMAQLVTDGMAAGAERYEPNADVFMLRRALAALPPDDCEPLILQVIGGFSCDEIARMLGVSVSAVTTRVARARRQLRGVLSDARHAGSNTARA